MSGLGGGTVGVTANHVRSSTFNLASPNPAVALLPGDNDIFSLYRFGNNTSDTCGSSAKITSIVITDE